MQTEVMTTWQGRAQHTKLDTAGMTHNSFIKNVVRLLHAVHAQGACLAQPKQIKQLTCR